MDENEWLAERFGEHRAHLRAVGYRMLGSTSEADDAVQETWLRLSRSDATVIENLGGWLTTVLARVCLNMLRSRRTRHEQPLDDSEPGRDDGIDPEQEAVLADSVGLALLVVLDTLTPAERLAFVLHDLFAVPFDELAEIVGRSPAATRQLASRARRRVHGAPTPEVDLARQRAVVDAFLAAARGGDFDALVAVLDPDVVLRTDGPAAAELRGALTVAGQAAMFGARAPFAEPALVDGAVGFVYAPRGRLTAAFMFSIEGDTVVAIDVITDADRLAGLELAVLED